jgi:hypothetical protein
MISVSFPRLFALRRVVEVPSGSCRQGDTHLNA